MLLLLILLISIFSILNYKQQQTFGFTDEAAKETPPKDISPGFHGGSGKPETMNQMQKEYQKQTGEQPGFHFQRSDPKQHGPHSPICVNSTGNTVGTRIHCRYWKCILHASGGLELFD